MLCQDQEEDHAVADLEEAHVAVEQVARAVVASAVDTVAAHAEVWVEDQEVPCITAHIGTDHVGLARVGTDQDQYLYLDHLDIMARVVEMDLIIKKIEVALVAL